MNHNFKIFLTGIILNITSFASVLDQKFVSLGGISPDLLSPRYTLTSNKTNLLPSTDLGINEYAPLDVPCINTYDVMGWSIPIKFATNITLQSGARDRLQTLLGHAIPATSTFQFIIQKASFSDATGKPMTRTNSGNSNGGIKQGQKEPISFKAQYPYIKYAPNKNWYGTTIDGVSNVTSYCIAGNVTVNSALIEDRTKLKYPERKVGLSIHSAGRSSTLSPDTLHLYRGGSTKPKTLDTNAVYPPADYGRLIKGEDKTKAFIYKVKYDGWKKRLNTTTKALPNEKDRYGIIVMLSDNDYDEFVGAINRKQTLREAIRKITIFTDNIEKIRLIDLLNNISIPSHTIPSKAIPISATPIKNGADKKAPLALQKKKQAEAKRQLMLQKKTTSRCKKTSREETTSRS